MADTATQKPTKRMLGQLAKRVDSYIKKSTETQEKIAQAVEKKNHQPDYGNRFAPLAWQVQKGAPNATRQLGERPYSMLKVAQLARGVIEEKDAVEETQISKRLYDAFRHTSFSGASACGKSWLVPLHTDYLPMETSQEAALVQEIKQKMVQPRLDWNEVQFLQQKGWKVDTKALGTIADTAGGTFVQPPQIIELLEMQYKIEAWSRAGSTQMPMMPNGRAIISKIQQGSTAFYADEGISFSTQSSQQTTGQLVLVAKKIGVVVPLNNELLRFGMPATETMVRYDMARQAALFLDAEQFAGTGGTHLKGLLTYPSQTPPWAQGTDSWLNYSASSPAPAGIGTTGNTFQPQDADMMANQLPDEITPDETTFLMTRLVYGGVSSRRATALTTNDQAGVFVGQRLVGITNRIREDVEGYRTVWSSNVPNNRVKSTSTNLTLAIAGHFPHWVCARLGVGEIVANSYSDTYWFADQTGLRLIQQADAGPRYLASFCIYDQLLNG